MRWVVRVTPAEKEKERFVPQWEKREKELAAARAARRENRVRGSSGHRYYYDYPASGYGCGWYGGYRPYYYGYGYRGCYGSGVKFSASYRGHGWSVRARY